MKTLLVAFLITLSSAHIFAEEEVFLLSPFSVDDSDEVGYRSTDQFPPIYITKPADFFAIQFQLINDSRLLEERAREIQSTVADIVRAANSNGFTVQEGQRRLDDSNYQINVKPYMGKTDTSYVQILLKVDLEDQIIRELTNDLINFLNGQKMTGRTYVLTTSYGLTIEAPQSYRHEILKKIAKDIEEVKALFSGAIELRIDGLDQRVSVKQSSDRNVDLYIPYAFSFINSIEVYTD